MGDTLCLRWSDFEKGIKQGFSRLRSDEDFYDVTLACGGGNQIKAHKVILATYSPLFKSLLKSLHHNHPLLYLRGIHFAHLESLLDFMYEGEVCVSPGDLDEFMLLAKDLQVSALVDCSSFSTQPAPQTEENADKLSEEDIDEEFMPIKQEDEANADNDNALLPTVTIEQGFEDVDPQNPLDVSIHTEEDQEDDQEKDHEDANTKTFKLLDMETEKFIEPFKDAKKFKCTKCTYSSPYKSTMRRHIEAKHLTTNGFSCHKCKKYYPTRNSFDLHRYRSHNYRKSFASDDITELESYDSNMMDTENPLELSPTEKEEQDESEGNPFQKTSPKVDTTSTSTKMFQCNKCQYCSRYKSSIRRHIKVMHAPNNIFFCDYCQKNYPSQIDLDTHNSLNHKREYFSTVDL